MLFTLCYNIGIHLISLYHLPRMLWLRLFKGKYKQSLSYRFGFNFPQVKRGAGPLIWIHAVSVGEARAIAPLVEMIKVKQPGCVILLSNTTEGGFRDSEKVVQADVKAYLPFDLPYIIKPIVKRVRPDMVILSETDFWYHFQETAKKMGSKVCVVNGKISERSHRRLKKLPFFAKAQWRTIDILCAQSQEYERRFLDLHFPPQHCLVTGNLKLDAEATALNAQELALLRQRLGLEEGQPVVVLGSTHEGEESALVPIMKSLMPLYPNLKVILVPRHIERIEKIKTLLEKEGVEFHCWTKGDALLKTPFVLVDQLGVLRQCYQIATIAVVCGSFTDKVGGHNLIEPAAYGVPVLYGPWIFSQPDLDALVKQFHCGLQTSLEEIRFSLIELLSHPEKRNLMGGKGLQLLQSCKGATTRTYQALFPT